MEFRELTERDLPSLIELYNQLDPEDDETSMEESLCTCREIEKIPISDILAQLTMTRWLQLVMLYIYLILQEVIAASVLLKM